MTLSEKTYIISNAATELGQDVAKFLLNEQCHIILAGPNYSELELMRKALQTDKEQDIKVALLEPSKDIDWLNLKEMLQKLEYQVAGIIHVHDISAVEQLFFETSHEQFTEMINKHLWGTYLSAKHLTPILIENDASTMIHLVKSTASDERPMYYTMITRALEAMLMTIQHEVNNKAIDIQYLQVDVDTLAHELSKHIDKS